MMANAIPTCQSYILPIVAKHCEYQSDPSKSVQSLSLSSISTDHTTPPLI